MQTSSVLVAICTVGRTELHTFSPRLGNWIICYLLISYSSYLCHVLIENFYLSLFYCAMFCWSSNLTSLICFCRWIGKKDFAWHCGSSCGLVMSWPASSSRSLSNRLLLRDVRHPPRGSVRHWSTFPLSVVLLLSALSGGSSWSNRPSPCAQTRPNRPTGKHAAQPLLVERVSRTSGLVVN